MTKKSFGEALGSLYGAFGQGPETGEAPSSQVKADEAATKKSFLAQLGQVGATLGSKVDAWAKAEKARIKAETPLDLERIRVRADTKQAEFLAQQVAEREALRREDPRKAFFLDHVTQIRAEAEANGHRISPEWFKRAEEAVFTNAPHKFLSGREHLDFLLTSIRDAKRSVIILSGWVSAKVVDADFLKLVDGKLSQGCDFLIGFGFVDSNGVHTSSHASKNAVAQLERLSNHYDGLRRDASHVASDSLIHPSTGKLTLRRYANHEKRLIVDEEFLVYGSNNWLSGASFHNSERSMVTYNPGLAKTEARQVYASAGKHN